MSAVASATASTELQNSTPFLLIQSMLSSLYPADAEAMILQEGNKHWGRNASAEDDGASGRPRRRLAKGLEGLDFLNSDDGEETD